jgi:DNA-binding transcriptional ArsR family regulator
MSVSAIFEALGEPSRRQIVAFLAGGESPVADIAAQFNATGPAVSQHLKVLREAGLVQVRRDGRRRIYALRTEALIEGASWLIGMSGGQASK